MRVFPVYAPKLIAKHARIFLTGAIWVKDLGRLEFSHGRFLSPKRAMPKMRAAINELNEILAAQQEETNLA